MSVLQTWIVLLLVVSPISFLAYGWDKRQAQKNGWRVPEKTLHSIDALGGWPGGLCAQQIFRHKTRKSVFQVKFWLTVVLHIVGILMIVNQA